MTHKPRFSAVVEEVFSGDDMIMMVDLGVDGLFKRVRCRLDGVDTPNAVRQVSDTEAGQVRDEIRLLTLRVRCSITVQHQGKGGWLVSLLVHRDEDGPPINVNEMLIRRGYVYEKPIIHKPTQYD